MTSTQTSDRDPFGAIAPRITGRPQRTNPATVAAVLAEHGIHGAQVEPGKYPGTVAITWPADVHSLDQVAALRYWDRFVESTGAPHHVRHYADILDDYAEEEREALAVGNLETARRASNAAETVRRLIAYADEDTATGTRH